MSETTTITTRGPVARYYVDEEKCEVIRRIGGQDEHITFADVPEDVWHRWGIEGYIHFRIAGHSHNDIVSRKAFPDRKLPAGQTKEPSLWVKAIAKVKAPELLRAAKVVSGEKLDKARIAELNEQALAWAKTLTSEQVKKLRQNKAVLIAHAELSGSTMALDAILAEPLGGDMSEEAGGQSSLQDAAD